MEHYLFVAGQVVGPVPWKDIGKYPAGTYGYSSGDIDPNPWFQRADNAIGWNYAEDKYIPKAFRAAMLLLGVP